MLRKFASRLIRDESAAVAATYVLSLVPIVAMVGVGYDFAQMASLDSELQAAADQAALAAATQLSGTSDSITEATSAASNLLKNYSLMSDSGVSAEITVQGLTFYATAAAAENDGPATTDPTQAKFVEVTINTQRSRYALTPIVGLIFSPNMAAGATAGMGSAMCNVPPMMICNPSEATDPGFTANYVGKGLKLTSVGAGGSWAPGNFGYIDVGAGGGNALIALREALGWNSPPGGCIAETGIDTRTGVITPVTDALNLRFDIVDTTGPGGGACPTGGDCAASINSTKDLVRAQNASGSNGCRIGPQGWGEPTNKYLPVSATDPGPLPDAMGHPRDICHALATPNCNFEPTGKVGNGVWDRATYFNVNYPGLNWSAWFGGSTTPTRYQVYRQEIAHRNDVYFNTKIGANMTVGGARVAEGTGGNAKLDHNTPICSSSINPLDENTVDRRTFPVAVVNCTAQNVGGNSTNVAVLKWMNVFLVEPSANRTRTSQQDVYVEVVSVNQLGNSDGGAAAVVRRDKPYLLK